MQNQEKAAGGLKNRLFFTALSLILLMSMLLPASAAAGGLKESSIEANIPLYLRQLEEYVGRLRQQEEEREKILKDIENALLTHEVEPGDTLIRLANRYGTSVEKIMRDNHLTNPDYIIVGQKLNILTIEGLLHRVAPGDTLAGLAALYEADAEEIKLYNGLENASNHAVLEEGQTLIVPGGRPPARAPLQLSSRGSRQNPPSFIWPLQGVVSSKYGPRWGAFHYGLDIAADYGTVLRAVAAGRVDCIKTGRGYGLYLVLDHGSGWQTLYAHNSRVLVQEEQWVKQGEPIARVGESGNATGPHTHFEVIKDGKKLDPLRYLP
ncbi:MAG: M23 family metallopeptidase [Firmicutes bacterium]|jgi:murein DD-endopeptidase MepM/ murein hydrolase activator NlpD|nr:M23 family metallopeptidase [Bacillota bacterium]